ncbi:hypothetical protein QLQ12_45920 [Actinoplanes sp. NEAU-A12]|uniref:Uncharacterized protein n=1 Tax=Actinoplanes sandaracinus TaxID=3045177 RepID=A0ABT6X1N5_9ACTN|nr:hypothetical protein [Actinoplanes sandaracinus]MDI6105932.1 hypothetical protein [Actinoplanes sandaracinus]
MSEHDQTHENLGNGNPGQERPIWYKPDGCIPYPVSFERKIFRTNTVALTVSHIAAFPNGFEITLTIAASPERKDFLRTFGMEQAKGRSESAGPPASLRIGVAFPDGNSATTADPYPPLDSDSDPPSSLIIEDGSAGANRLLNQRYWIWPLPPDGRVRLLIEWPAENLGPSVVDIEAEEIVKAARQAVDPWR